jgi:hypothetical protein
MAAGMPRERGGGGTNAVVLHASRRKAALLAAIAAVVVLAFAGVDWFRGSEPAVRYAAVLLGLALAGYFASFALALFFRRRPVFAADAEGLALPVGMTGLVRVPWSQVADYAIVSRRFRLLPFLSSTAFGARLTAEGRKSGAFTEAQKREFRLNEASMGVDVLLTHWFSPVSLDEVRAAARRFRPDLDRTGAAVTGRG